MKGGGCVVGLGMVGEGIRGCSITMLSVDSERQWKINVLERVVGL